MSSVSTGLDRDTAAFRARNDEPAWKLELHKKVAAARARRSVDTETAPHTSRAPGSRSAAAHGPAPRAADVAAAVAARFAQAPTYRELLAQETQQAAEAAAIAAREAQQAAEVLVATLERQREAEEWEGADRAAEAAAAATLHPESLRVEFHPEIRQHLNAHLDAMDARVSARESARGSGPGFTPPPPMLSDPMEEVVVEPATLLNANLIEFPRELVAPRKARPRLAEGPLRDGEGAAGNGHIRIFEAEPDTPRSGSHLPAAEWSSIHLDAQAPAAADRTAARSALDLPLKTAPLADRLMAALVDGALASIGFLLFVLAFYALTAHPPAGRAAVLGAAVAFAGVVLLYQVLFFTLGESTPGMLYARIALCTFDDSNPSRKVMCRRIGALLLAVFPAGLGLLWAVFDEDRLGWHDRISGTYQRSYR